MRDSRPTAEPRRGLRPAWPFLFALLAGYAGCLEAQSTGAVPSVTGFLGYTPEEPEGFLAGVELRTPELGRWSVAASGSTWGFNVGCDLITGPPCPGENAKAFDIGPVVRLTPRGLSWRLEATARLGGLWFNRIDGGVWNPSAGLALGFGELRRVGVMLGLRYHALTGTIPPPRDTNDRVVVSAGLQLHL